MVPEIKESIVLDKLAKFDVQSVYGKVATGQMSGLERYKLNEEQTFDALNRLWTNTNVLSALIGSVFVICYSIYEHSSGALSDSLMISFVCLGLVIFGLCRELVVANRNIACMRWNSTVISIANGLYESSVASVITHKLEVDGAEITEAARESTQTVIDLVSKSVTEELKEEYDIYDEE